jgi:hypothetical protein
MTVANLTRRAPAGEFSYDEEAWRNLVENDPDLAQLNAVLAHYGQQYVDEFASSYLAAPEKRRLTAIVDEIIAKARQRDQVRAIRRAENSQSSTRSNREPTTRKRHNRSKRDSVEEHAPKMVGPLPAVTDLGLAEAATLRPDKAVADELHIDVSKQDQGRDNGNTTSANDHSTKLVKKFASDSRPPS